MKFWKQYGQMGLTLPQVPADEQEYFEGTQCVRLDGKRVAQMVWQQCAERASGTVVPKLGVILVGDDPASHTYVAAKERNFAERGFQSHSVRLPASTSQDALLEQVKAFNRDASIHGVLVQLPLPKHIEKEVILENIAPEKDVDGFLNVNLGLLAKRQWDGVLPCTPFGVMVLLASYGMADLSGKEVVVVGRSNIVGKPMALLMDGADATVTLTHFFTRDLKSHTKRADVVVVAVGKHGLITADHIKPGAVVVDVGMNRLESGKLVGDCLPEVTRVAKAFTPVPGCVGPMTIAMLGLNTTLSALRSVTSSEGHGSPRY